ncbi:E3 ubiquitin-protein ligase listerin isoform X2 [Anoplophora glabripennis]|uniref:E3 ubiquitin-protein ligase listerin isoform X2 n=1 Tax=Anoplophora glabripennis TaxID=217634 RepID=UPI000874AD22|nr:E3 ubiquitin-protein ligase listerin isoform X2 [Anoplophora glabripennis]
MGGKHKVANRTKNNARPSSSGRSAELLGSSIPQFVGFSGIKDAGFGLAGFSLSTTEEFDSSIDPNIQLVLKKISKKDSTTKLKGLQEFADLVKNSEADSIKALLPVWPRFYNVLSTDIDNRVREATHNVHHEIVLKAKRNIAPYLKQLMAPWFTSQYDTYPPAASAAAQAFKDAFPVNKFQEAVVYCQEEILSYINDNLLVQTAQTLSNTKNTSAEDAEAKYERVLISCLQGYCLYLEKVSSDQIQNVVTLNNDIVSNGKFWKLAKHKVSPVRAAWFKALTVLCQKAAFLLEGKGAQLVSTVFNNLEENEPTVLPYVWEAALLTMANIKEWWTFINIEKQFFPKLWKILKQGGQGNASVIYPNLLPLISHLPATVDENAQQFYNTFFENLRLGLKQKTVIASRSESVAVATAFTECLQYVVLKKQLEVPLCKTLIKNHLLSTIEWCLIEDQASYKSVFNQVAALVQYWSRNARTEGFDDYLHFFFESVSDLLRDTLFNSRENKNCDVSSVCLKEIEFLQSLKHINKPKKQFKVKFNQDETEIGESVQSSNISTVETNQIYFEKLNLLVYKVCEDYVEYIEETQSKVILEYLCSLIVDFDTKNFFVNLNEKMKKKNSGSQLIDIFNDKLYKWLNSGELCCKQVVDLIFLLFSYVTDDDKQLILRKLSEISTEDCLGWCVSEGLSHPHNKDPLVKDWLRNTKVSEFIVSIAEKEIKDESSSECSVLFRLALTENEDGELLIHSEAVSQIISKLIATLEHYNDYTVTLDTCSSLAAYISAIIYTENLLLTYGSKLLLSLFKLSCNSNLDHEVISAETIYEVNTAWQDAVTLLTKSLSLDASKDLTGKFADILENEFLCNDMGESHVDHLASVAVSFIKAVHRSRPLGVSDFLCLFLERSFVPAWRTDLNSLCKVAEYVKGNLSSPFDEIRKPSEDVQEWDILRYFVWTYLKLRIVGMELDGDEEEEEEEEEDEGIKPDKKSVYILNVIDESETFISEILYDLSYSQSYLQNFKNTKYYESILNYYVLTEMKLKTVLENVDHTFKLKLKSILKGKSIGEAWFWCKTAYILYSDITPEPPSDIYKEFVGDVSTANSLGVLHLTQVFGRHLDFDYVQNKFEAVGNVVILRSLILCDEIDVQIAEVFGQIEKIRSENVPQFLYNTNIGWVKAQEIVEVVRLCSGLMKHKFSSLSRRHWDFGVLSLVSWASNCLKSRASFEKYEFQALLIAVANHYISTDNQIKLMKEQELKSSYIDEWRDVLVESIHSDLAQLWLYLAEQMEVKQFNVTYLPLIQEFGAVINNINYDFIFKFNDTSLPKWTKFLKRGCSLLVCPQPNLQLWGYKMLHVLVPGLVKIDTEAVNTNTPHRKGLIFEQFKEKLVETHGIVNSMLMGFKLGEDSCRVEPSTDSFTYTFAYLLLWDVLLTLCDQASTELRYQYADWLRNEDLLKNFLNNLFRLMPTEVLHFNEGKSKSLLEVFLEKPPMDVRDTCNSQKIERLVCWLYASTLAQLPALVRQWWTSLETKIAQVVEKVTSVYVSPHLCTQELNDVMAHQTKFKNMTVRVIPTVREVIAIYTVDEAQMELVITLPANYPLGGLDVQCNRQIGGTTHKQWLLQLKKCVLHQNGRIWDGLSLWNNNLDKKFDGVEECYICFSVLHPGTYQLPKLSCQTCKKKFHSACLYKWFSTSNKSSCPICRNLF